MTWAVQSITTTVAAVAQVDQEDKKKFLSSLQERTLETSAERKARVDSESPEDKVQPGSYEKLMSLMGGSR